MATEIGIKIRVKRWVANRAEECRNVAPLYSYALDRKLTLLERVRIRFHLLTCNACTNYVENLKFMHEMFRQHDSILDSDDRHIPLRQEAKERIKNSLKS